LYAHNNEVPSPIQRWFIQLLYKDVFVLNKTAHRSVYQTFAGENVRAAPHHFFERVRNYAIGCLAMREVFHMESYVRLAAIQNLGKSLSCLTSLLGWSGPLFTIFVVCKC